MRAKGAFLSSHKRSLRQWTTLHWWTQTYYRDLPYGHWVSPSSVCCQQAVIIFKQVLLHPLAFGNNAVLHFANLSLCQQTWFVWNGICDYSNHLPGLYLRPTPCHSSSVLGNILLPPLLYSRRPWLGTYKAPNKYVDQVVYGFCYFRINLSTFKFDKAGICTSPIVRLGSIQEVGIGAFFR